MNHSPLAAAQLALLNQATITIADLADGYLALTLGTTITLDTDAAGYGWFIDPTPWANEEFIPNSSPITDHASPWQLQAAPGSAADGKIDLMTVLMHELGHVMGLGHVSSAVDNTRLMAGSIDPGIRRLPSSLDLGPVESSHDNNSELSTQNSALPTWAPYLAHYTSTNHSPLTIDHSLPAVNPARLVQAAQTPSHAGIFNSNFAISDPQSATFGWDQSGAVTIANGQAVLSEDSNVISTLSQLFTLPAGSTHLRFTLVDVNLQTNGTNRPPDAFEVALLESSTLTPLAGVTAGLTQTDSLFNLQQDGTVRFSNRVSLSNGTISGSTLDLTQPVLVDIDLTGVATGAGARLSFDLLGFGDRTSTIVLDNVLLTNGQATATPVAVNDSYTVAEGATLNVPTLGLLANDSDTDTPAFGLTAFSLTPPTHGTLTVNADGSFTYTHNGTETLTDSFTYRVSDGINFSNLATVSLTITPTNDAPVLAAIAPQFANRGATLTFTAVATDPDDSNISPESNILIYSLAPNTLSGATIDPATGLFTWAVPVAQALGLTTVTVRVTDNGTPALFAERTVAINVQPLVNQAPVLAPIGAKSINEQTELRFTISATDADVPAQTLTYSASGLPVGATFNPTTREFTWTPTEQQGPGSYVVTFSVTDGIATVSEAVTITVAEVNLAPVLAPIGPKTVNEQTELRFTISGSDLDDPAQTLVYSAIPLPPGATFNPVTREFVWTPTELQGPGSYVVTFSVTDSVVTTSEAVTITVGEVNLAPVLAPITDKTVNEGSLLTFTATATDADVPTQSVIYSLAAGAPTGATIDASTGVFTWTPTEAQGPNVYQLTINATDGIVTVGQTFNITVNEVNVAPVLNPIGPKTVNELSELRFTISGSDTDVPNQTLTYSATPLPPGATFTPATGEFVWTPTEAQGPGSYQVTFSVTDGEFSASEIVTITVNEVNVAPILNAIGPKTVNELTELRFTISATDVDQPTQTLVYSATGLPTGASFNATTHEFVWTPTEAQGPGSFVVTFNVSDGVVSTSEAVTVTVNEVNVAPVLGAITDKTVNEGSLLTFTAVATDADFPTQVVTYSLAAGAPTGAVINANTGLFTWTPTEAQGPNLYTLTINATDGIVTVGQTFTITVNEVNVAPVLNPIGAKTVNELTELRFTISATDVDQPTQTLVYSATGLPTGASFNATTHEFVWIPTEAQGPGSFVVTFSVTDGVVATSEAVTITVNEVNVAPVFTSIGPKTVGEGSLLSFIISASDADFPNQTLVYSATGLPTGALFDQATRTFSWTPTEAQGPSAPVVTFSVTDGIVTTSEAVTITVTEVNVAPVLQPITNKNINAGSLLTFTAVATDPDLPFQPLAFSLAAGAPTGAAINPVSGVFTWTPTVAQASNTYSLTVNVTDSIVTVGQSFTVTVNSGNTAPVLTPIGPKTVAEGTLLSFIIVATDADLPAQTLIYSATPLPPGATFTPATRTFSWTPTEAQGPSTNVVTFSVSDGIATVSEAVTITVTEVNVAPVLTAIGPKTVAEGNLLSFTISATDADIPNQVLAYSATGLPTGATFNATTRTFSWTPTEAQGPSAPVVTFSVSDGVTSVSEAVTITVTEVNVAPVLTAIGPKTVAEGTLLSFIISATDADVPAQTLTYSATGLPTGATFSAATRTFSWTPTEAQGPSAPVVTFSVTDGVVTTSEAVTITVTEVNVAPVLQPITNKTVNEGSLLTFTAVGSDADLPAQTLTYSLASGAPSGAVITATTGVFTWTPTDGPGASPYSVTVQVNDGVATTSQIFAITVLNVAPTATLTVPSAAAGVDLTFSGVIGDVGSLDTLQVSWNFGDGSSLPFQAAARGTVTTTHQYATAGTYTVTLTVKDNNGAQTSVSSSLSVVAVGLTTDPCDATKTALVVNGTATGDNITVSPSGSNYQVFINSLSQGIFAKPTGHIIVHGWGGGDNITINSTITTPTILFGDAGGDNITGGAGPNIIVGGADSGDNLIGGSSRDLLIGGSGGDNLTGNGEDDLLIAGTTVHETNVRALCDIMSEWVRTDKTYSQRVSNLLNGGGLNGTTKLNATTVFDDAIGDNLTGNAGTDWFFAKQTAPNQDNVTFVTGETVTAQGTPPAPLLAQGGARAEDGSIPAVTTAQLAPIVDEAKARWIASELTAEQAAALASLHFTIADLDGATIGLTDGTSVLIDRTAAGYGWFIDPTPQDNAEFHFVRGLAEWIADAHSPAFSRMDLLTTVMHELGHVLGFNDQSQAHTLMSEILNTGVRRTVAGQQDHMKVRGHQSFQADPVAWVNGALGTELRQQAAVLLQRRSADRSDRILSTLQSDGLIDWDGSGQAHSHTTDVSSFVPTKKTSWLHRFLLNLGAHEEELDPNHDLEVVLPGKHK